MAYLEPSQTSKTKIFTKIVNGLNHQIVFAIASTHGTNIVGLGSFFFFFLFSYIFFFLLMQSEAFDNVNSYETIFLEI